LSGDGSSEPATAGRLTRGAGGAPSFQEAVMVNDDISLIGPDEIAYRLELTPPELKVTYSALKSFLNDFGHDE
jgi:hypothetical protein